jgi:hypothetical protein
MVSGSSEKSRVSRHNYHCSSCEGSCLSVISQDAVDPRDQDRRHWGCETKQVETQDFVLNQYDINVLIGRSLTFQRDWNVPNQQAQASEQQYCLVYTHDYPQGIEHA